MTLKELNKLIKSNPKADSDTYYQIEKGLAEVCEMLAKSKESTEEQKKSFLQHAEVFRRFAIFHKAQLNNKEVKMVKEVKKQPTQEEIENKKVQEIIQEIIALEKKYPQKLVKRACYRYNNAILEKNKAERDIKVLEQKLNQAKARLK